MKVEIMYLLDNTGSTPLKGKVVPLLN